MSDRSLPLTLRPSVTFGRSVYRQYEAFNIEDCLIEPIIDGKKSEFLIPCNEQRTIIKTLHIYIPHTGSKVGHPSSFDRSDSIENISISLQSDDGDEMLITEQSNTFIRNVKKLFAETIKIKNESGEFDEMIEIPFCNMLFFPSLIFKSNNSLKVNLTWKQVPLKHNLLIEFYRSENNERQLGEPPPCVQYNQCYTITKGLHEGENTVDIYQAEKDRAHNIQTSVILLNFHEHPGDDFQAELINPDSHHSKIAINKINSQLKYCSIFGKNVYTISQRIGSLNNMFTEPQSSGFININEHSKLKFNLAKSNKVTINVCYINELVYFHQKRTDMFRIPELNIDPNLFTSERPHIIKITKPVIGNYKNIVERLLKYKEPEPEPEQSLSITINRNGDLTHNFTINADILTSSPNNSRSSPIHELPESPIEPESESSAEITIDDLLEDLIYQEPPDNESGESGSASASDSESDSEYFNDLDPVLSLYHSVIMEMLDQYCRDNADARETNETCCITLAPIDRDTYYYECIQCKKLMQKEALDKWIRTKKINCPHCRKEFKDPPKLYHNKV